MAVVLSLTYFMNLAFARVLSEEGLILLKKLAGTTFTVQLGIKESVVSENQGLVESLFYENEFTMTYLDRFLSGATQIKGLIQDNSQGFFDLYDSLLVAMERAPNLQFAADMRYRAFKAMRACPRERE